MKKRLSPFVAGMATMALLGSLGVSALAATGAFSITVNPINIQVNGETFQPKDAQGNDVPVFSLDGTTYAPLRALAEAYGLEVGYDAGANMATVGAKAADPTPDTALSDDYSDWTAEEEAAYQEFKGMWTVAEGESIYHNNVIWRGDYSGPISTYNELLGTDDFRTYLHTLGRTALTAFVQRFASEVFEEKQDYSKMFELYCVPNQAISNVYIEKDGSLNVGLDPFCY